jgi:hypothetical protein
LTPGTDYETWNFEVREIQRTCWPNVLGEGEFRGQHG